MKPTIALMLFALAVTLATYAAWQSTPASRIAPTTPPSEEAPAPREIPLPQDVPLSLDLPLPLALPLPSDLPDAARIPGTMRPFPLEVTDRWDVRPPYPDGTEPVVLQPLPPIK